MRKAAAMTDRESAPVSDLPIACAVLYNFDAESLRAIAGLDADAARAVLASAEVAPLAPEADRYQIMPQAQAALLAQLRRERPGDERALHRQAFDLYIKRLAAGDTQPDLPDVA